MRLPSAVVAASLSLFALVGAAQANPAVSRQVERAWQANRFGQTVKRPSGVAKMTRFTIPMKVGMMDSAHVTVYRRPNGRTAYLHLEQVERLPWEGIETRSASWHRLKLAK